MPRSNILGIGDPIPEQDPFRSGLLMERIMKALLQETVDRWVKDSAEAKRFFSYFFETTVGGQKELDSFLNAFKSKPPRTQLGYARIGAMLPLWAIVLSEETEEDAFLSDYLGQDDSKYDFEGDFWDANYTVYTYSEHPDLTQVYYQLSKAIIAAGRPFLVSSGALTIHLSGGDLAPDENYMPENMFVRALRVRMKHQFSAPRIKPADPAKLRTWIYASDVVVEGIQGGVKVYDAEETTE